jgi:16S rRNA (cytosine1402-N4)-methyltransferase
VIEHVPVLLEETLRYLDVKPGGFYADLTLGLGGHAAGILKRLGPGGRLVGVDRDAEAVERATENLKEFKGRLTVIKADFALAPALIKESGMETLDGFLMDLGVSSLQFRTPGRGFSFSMDAPLDMRMDPSSGRTAAELVNGLGEDELTELIYKYGEERWARAIARRITARRATSPITTTLDLAEEVKKAIPPRFWPPRIHPATRTFQALRIAVNDELGSLARALEPMLGMLRPGGRAVVISYHSLEDRHVKDTFRSWARGCVCPPDFPKCVCGNRPRLKPLTKKPVTPSEREVSENPGARSAKLRAAERL